VKLVATLSGVIGIAFAAVAGPEPLPESKAVVAPTSAPYNWTGFYFGINGGYAFDLSSDVSDLDFLNAGPPVQSFSFDSDGPVAGGQIGFNLQPLRWLVLGVEGDGGYFGVDGRERQPTSPDPGTFAEVNPGAYATARGRIGLAWDRWLFYATGGWIGSDYERKVVDKQICLCGFPLGSGEDEDWRSGWVVGGGIEWAFHGDHWTMRIEYLYFDFDDGNVTVPIVQQGPFRFGWDDNTGNIIRAGLNYKF
jgi:outer membrane immunogenic protein